MVSVLPVVVTVIAVVVTVIVVGVIVVGVIAVVFVLTVVVPGRGDAVAVDLRLLDGGPVGVSSCGRHTRPSSHFSVAAMERAEPACHALGSTIRRAVAHLLAALVLMLYHRFIR